jgi:5-methylcytosine-specific restriction endonuclease McrA
VRVLKENVIKYQCAECGMFDKWNGKKIILQLDHINGVNNDNRVENLRFLCPNCHSQTKTYSGKNRNKRK